MKQTVYGVNLHCKQARNPGTFQKKIANYDGLDRLTDRRTDGLIYEIYSNGKFGARPPPCRTFEGEG